MPFLNPNSQRGILEEYDEEEFLPDPSWGETFSAGVGFVWDEESSVSGFLNREGERNRKAYVEELIDNGTVNKDQYQNVEWGSPFDYDQLAKDMDDPRLKSNEQLRTERNEMLARRRENAQDIFERGSGTAAFLGKTVGFLSDPISIMTMPIATASVASKSLGVLGRSLMVARNAAIVEGATEIGIQAFVYKNKHDIDSPYSYQEAITNIAMAATGASVLGGGATAIGSALRPKTIKGYVGEVIELAKKADLDDDGKAALEYLQRFADSLPEREKLHPALGEAYEKFLAGEIKDFDNIVKPTVESIEKSIRKLEKSSDTYTKMISRNGGLSRESFLAEGVDPEAFKTKNYPSGQRLFPKTGGHTADSLAELLNEVDGGARTSADMVELVHDITSGRDEIIDGAVRAEIDGYHRQIAELEDVAPPSRRVYQGSPSEHGGELDAEFIGSGEGNTTYGYGHYVAENRAVGEQYFDDFSVTRKTYTVSDGRVIEAGHKHSAVLESAAAGELDKHIEFIKSTNYTGDELDFANSLKGKTIDVQESPGKAYLYEHDLDEDLISKMLDLDDLIDDPAILRKLEKTDWWEFAEEGIDDAASMRGENATGRDLIRWLEDDYTPAEVSEVLRKAGIPGNKYFDGGSRRKGEGTQNFVIFPGSEKGVKAVSRNGKKMKDLEAIFKGATESELDFEVKYLESMEAQRKIINEPPEYADMGPPKRPDTNAAPGIDRQRDMLSRSGLADEYDEAMRTVAELDDARILQGDELVDADTFLKEVDDELDGIDSLLRCVNG